jgi:hypothetical protein
MAKEKEIREMLEAFTGSRHAIEPCAQSHDPQVFGKYCGCGGCHLWRMFNHAEELLASTENE